MHTIRRIVVCALFACGVAPLHADPIVVPMLLTYKAEKSWSTFVMVANRSASTIATPGVLFLVNVPPIPEPTEMEELPPGTVGELAIANASGLADAPAGVMLDVADAENVDVSARIRSSPAGFVPGYAEELPVAHASDFQSKPLHFDFVPFLNADTEGPRALHLRLYSLSDAPVRVRIDIESAFTVAGPFTATREIALTPQPAPAPPRFIFVDLPLAFPTNARAGFQNVTVTPLPLDDGSVPAVWGFVSATSATYAVRIFTAK